MLKGDFDMEIFRYFIVKHTPVIFVLYTTLKNHLYSVVFWSYTVPESNVLFDSDDSA